jgi:hypothetical protein
MNSPQTSRGYRSISTRAYISNTEGLVLEEGQKYVYEFATADKIGTIELMVVRDLGGEFLMRGEVTGHFRGANGSVITELGTFTRSEHFLVDKGTGTSPGINYFSRLWNYCGNIFTQLAEAGGAGNLKCVSVLKVKKVDYESEPMFGLVSAKARSTGRPSYSDMWIMIKSQSTLNNKGGEKEDKQYFVSNVFFLNMALAGLLIIKGIRDMGRTFSEAAERKKWNM